MLDPLMRRWIGPSLDRAGAWLARRGMSANAFSIAGLGVGLATIPLLAWERYDAALVVILVNRVCDGLDGAIARHKGATPFGGYVDIMCDMGFYAAVPLGFALARPENAPWAALLLASFVCTASSFLGRAVLAAQRGEPDDGARGRKSFFNAAGLIEGTETIVAFALFCFFPAMFAWLAGAFAGLCFWTAAGRVVSALKFEQKDN